MNVKTFVKKIEHFLFKPLDKMLEWVYYITVKPIKHRHNVRR